MRNWTLDSRDVYQRICELESEVKHMNDSPDEYDSDDIECAKCELATLESFRAEIDHPDFMSGMTLISENYFTEYTQEFANDIGAVDLKEGWPFNHIDWDAAADELRMDYSSAELDGTTYLFRS